MTEDPDGVTGHYGVTEPDGTTGYDAVPTKPAPALDVALDAATDVGTLAATLRALLDAGTPLPWFVNGGEVWHGDETVCRTLDAASQASSDAGEDPKNPGDAYIAAEHAFDVAWDAGRLGSVVGTPRHEPDAALIVAVVNALPRILALLDHARTVTEWRINGPEGPSYAIDPAHTEAQYWTRRVVYADPERGRYAERRTVTTCGTHVTDWERDDGTPE